MTMKLVMAAAMVLGAAVAIPHAAFAGGSLTKSVDTDNDGTIDLKEVLAAATAHFDTLDKDHDGTLDAKELRIGAEAFATADTDKDGTVDKQEYSTFVQAQFKAADPDNDGTVSAAELKTTKGAALSQLMK